MVQIKGLKSLVGKIQQRAARLTKEKVSEVIVGYSAGYAVKVHEDLMSYYKVGQAKFLEQPARLLRNELALMIFQAYRSGRTMTQSILLAGLRLQRESQLLVPVDTGFLKNSAFTRIVRGSNAG